MAHNACFVGTSLNGRKEDQVEALIELEKALLMRPTTGERAALGLPSKHQPDRGDGWIGPVVGVGEGVGIEAEPCNGCGYVYGVYPGRTVSS